MSTSYDQFLACLRNSSARRLLGIEMTDGEAAILAADRGAALAYFHVWSERRELASSSATAPPVAASTQVERTLLDISTVGRGGEPAKVRVTTSRLFVSTTGGVSAWKTFLGVATLGLSTAVTGINAGTGGDLDIPISAVSAALVTRAGLAYSTVKLTLGGDAVEFGLASTVCNAVVGAINAAVTGQDRAAAAAEAWMIYQQGRGREWPSEARLRKQRRNNLISQTQFEYSIAVSRSLQALATV